MGQRTTRRVRPSPGRRGTLLAAVVAAVALTACEPPLPTGYQPVEVRGLTWSGGGVEVASDGTGSVVWAATEGGDARVVWSAVGSRSGRDQQSCATWVRWDGESSQPGVALRIRAETDRTRAITVTDNVTFGARWGFNVHVWDTARREADGSVAVTKVGGVTLADTFLRAERFVALPWRLCARIVGRTLTFKAWPTAIAEPAWGDVRYGATFTLPESVAYDGVPGWFAGHLEGDDQLHQTDQVAGPVPPMSPPRSRPAPRATGTARSRWRLPPGWPGATVRADHP